jgi:hypothetical protein
MEISSNSKTDDKEVLAKPMNMLKKKPKDYFFDFFMLFLAVTLGFFVNNLNDGLAERKREKQYMISLINDLRIDTAEIQSTYLNIKIQIVGIDSLMRIIEKKDQDNFISDLYYFSVKYLNSATFFTSCDRTISQLKSAGGLRLIQKITVSDSIMQYYSSSDNVKYNTEFCLKEFNEIADSEKEIFNFKSLRGYNAETIKYLKDLKLLIVDPVEINKYYNQVIFYASALINYNGLLTELRKEAESLLNFTKESYNLK